MIASVKLWGMLDDATLVEVAQRVRLLMCDP